MPNITEPFSTVATYSGLPLSFEANHGQTDPRVTFLARGSGYTLSLTQDEAILLLRRPEASKTTVELLSERKPTSPKQVKNTALRMNLAGANRQPQVEGQEELPGKANYFLGNDPAKWRTDIPTYARVKYRDVYPGVDMIYYGNQGQLEWDFVVAPGADPAAITLAFQGIDRLEADEKGDLLLQASGEEIRLRKPFVYQEADGGRREITSVYVVKDHNRVSFQLEEYDAAKPLVIDPVLLYSTYLGGSEGDFGDSIAVDLFGNTYVTGNTSSLNFPTQNPLQPAFGSGLRDAFVTKIDPSGSVLLYSTYLGGSGSDSGNGIAVDIFGNAYVTGSTGSTNFPIKNPLQPVFGGGLLDAFVTKINAFGSGLIYSTYLGGNALDTGSDIAVDFFGNAYVTGRTESPNFPITLFALQPVIGGGDDAFVTKIDPFGFVLIYSTYLGGSENESGNGIAVDLSGNAYVTGSTNSPNFPTQNPLQPNFSGPTRDAFVSKINAFGSALVYSTYLGGSADDTSNSIAVDFFGNAYVTGNTNSTNFPTQNPLQPTFAGGLFDAFITKINVFGSDLIYSTYLGGSGDDIGNGIAVDLSGNAYVTGLTTSPDFPTQNPLQPVFGGGNFDAFVTKINVFGSDFFYSTYLGGSGVDSGESIAVDLLGNAYVTGNTDSLNFPTSNPLQPTIGGSFDAFVAKIFSFVPV